MVNTVRFCECILCHCYPWVRVYGRQRHRDGKMRRQRKDKQILIYDGWKSEICIKLKARRDSWRWAVREWVSEWCEIIKNDFQNVLSTPFCAVDMMSGSLSFVCAIAFIWMTPDIEWDGENKRRRCNFSSKFFFFRNSCSREQKLHIEDQPSDSFLFDETLAS